MTNLMTILLSATLLALPGAARATNPCDVDQKLCDAWNKSLEQMHSFQAERTAYAMPSRDTGINDTCPDGRELPGRGIEATVTFKDTGKSSVIKLAFAGCQVEHPRDEPPAPDYSHRSYGTKEGDYLGVYANLGETRATVSLTLADGSSSATLIEPTDLKLLASGEKVDLGEVLLVKLSKGSEGVVIPVKLSLRSYAP